jgi:hypothetical protein
MDKLFRYSVCVTNEASLLELAKLFEADYIPDPVLMPSGRPNVVEGIGAIYHLVKGDDDEIAFYVIKADPGLNNEYARKKMIEGDPLEVKPGEFDGADMTESLDHGVTPALTSGGGWRIYKVYEKKTIWVRYKEDSV